MPELSFVVPVRDQAAHLRACLEAVRLAASWLRASTGAEIEILVVDNGSRDASREVALEAGARLLCAPDVALGALRNRGWRAARGEWVAFVDADVEIAPSWAATALEILTDPAAAGAGADYRAPSDGTWVQRTYDLLRRRSDSGGEARWLPAGNLVLRRRALEAVGGFDERLAACEDVDLCLRLRERGLRLRYDGRLVAVHRRDPRTLGELFRQELRRGRSNLAVTLRPRPGIGQGRELPSALVPLAVLALLVLIVAGALLGRGQRLTAGAALGLGLLAGARALHMVRDQPWGLLPRALAVGMVYDLARALAVLDPLDRRPRS